MTEIKELPYHRWPRSYGGWQAGSFIRCEGHDCRWCKSHWTLVDPQTFEDIPTHAPPPSGEGAGELTT